MYTLPAQTPLRLRRPSRSLVALIKRVFPDVAVNRVTVELTTWVTRTRSSMFYRRLYAWYDFAGNIGVALMVLGYLLLQAEKIRSSDLSYSLMNGLGALLVVISLLYRFNLSAFLVEAFWFLISIYGLIKFAVRPRAKESR